MAIENRQEQRLYAMTTREDMGGVWRAEGIEDCGPWSLRATPSTHGQWATGLIGCMAMAMRPPFGKASARCPPNACHHDSIGVHSA